MSSWGEQFSTGDQSISSRELFWKNSYRICPICNKENVTEVKDCAGCRHNGDGYGTCIFTCNDCNWTTSFQYDEADTPYFYETKYFGEAKCAQQVKETPKPPERTEALLNGFRQILRIGGPTEFISHRMKECGYEEEFVAKFVEENRLTSTPST